MRKQLRYSPARDMMILVVHDHRDPSPLIPHGYSCYIQEITADEGSLVTLYQAGAADAYEIPDDSIVLWDTATGKKPTDAS